jgi:hypothetical protein
VNTRLEASQNKGTLRLSQMGPRCPRQLWYMVNKPEEEEQLKPATYIKFNYGHLLEAMVIEYAKLAGHEVTGEQDVLTLDGVQGHRDCVIDGCVADVKSASSFSFQKFKDGSIRENDTFGYLDQLDGYVVASLDDPLVKVKDKGYLIAVDKTLGHMVIYEHRIRESSIRARIKAYRRIVESDTPPPCECRVVEDGKAGNLKLDTRASYSTYKHCCFPSLRTFLYSDGPRFLAKVVKRPAEHILEVDRHGKVVYN